MKTRFSVYIKNAISNVNNLSSYSIFCFCTFWSTIPKILINFLFFKSTLILVANFLITIKKVVPFLLSSRLVKHLSDDLNITLKWQFNIEKKKPKRFHKNLEQKTNTTLFENKIIKMFSNLKFDKNNNNTKGGVFVIIRWGSSHHWFVSFYYFLAKKNLSITPNCRQWLFGAISKF